MNCAHTGIDIRFCAHCVGSKLPAQRDEADRPYAKPNERIGPAYGESLKMPDSDGISASDVKIAYSVPGVCTGNRSKYYTGKMLAKPAKPLFTPVNVQVRKAHVDTRTAAFDSGTCRQGIWTQHGFSAWGREQDRRTWNDIFKAK